MRSVVAIANKRRRLNAYISSLNTRWLRLDEFFRQRYAIKIRREMQRPRLLEQNVAVPPTLILDENWHSERREDGELATLLSGLLEFSNHTFRDDITKRIITYQPKQKTVRAQRFARVQKGYLA